MDDFEKKDSLSDAYQIADTDDGKNEKKKSGWKKELLEWVEAIVVAVVISWLITTFVFVPVKVEGSSMVPTLHEGDRLIVLKLNYSPHKGDVVVFTPPTNPNDLFVKRVIGTPEDKVDIDFKQGKVFVNDQELVENYINSPTNRGSQADFPQVVPQDAIFALGDNRNNSHDSRSADIGMIPYSKVLGKVSLRIWPLNAFGFIK